MPGNKFFFSAPFDDFNKFVEYHMFNQECRMGATWVLHPLFGYIHILHL